VGHENAVLHASSHRTCHVGKYHSRGAQSASTAAIAAALALFLIPIDLEQGWPHLPMMWDKEECRLSLRHYSCYSLPLEDIKQTRHGTSSGAHEGGIIA
jgi:hypothetical protein